MKKADGSNIALTSDDNSQDYLRLYIKLRKNVRIKTRYTFSDGEETDKKDPRFDAFRRAVGKDYIPSWINEVGIKNVEGFIKEFNLLKTISPKFEIIKKVKVGGFEFSK